MLAIFQEKRPLKKPRLGPPDVYPQEPKQKEDELTTTNVKHGFSTMTQLPDEFGTAHNSNITAARVGAFFNSILAKKEELMTLQDSGRKKQQINTKDNFWPVSPRTKVTLDAWFKDLAGNKPLQSLAKRAPSFNKKEEIFTMLCDNQVSMQRAAWFIKLSSAYTAAVSEAKIKKRQMSDPATEWTGTLIKFMKDLILKLQEHYHHGASQERTSNHTQVQPPSTYPPTIPPPMTSPASLHSPANSSCGGGFSSTTPISQDDAKYSLKQWNYCTQLSKYMFEETLLDRQEFLNWIIELLDKTRTQPSDDGLLKLVLPFTLQYMQDFVHSERLSRKLAYIVAKKLSNMVQAAENQMNVSSLVTQNNRAEQNATQFVDMKQEPNKLENKPSIGLGNSLDQLIEKDKRARAAQDPIESILMEYVSCPHHRDIILQLSTILQVITIECPTALVWCWIGESRSNSSLVGSPLDHLSIAPSNLPLPSRNSVEANNEIRRQLQESEENIRIRSQHAENRWCAEKWQKANTNSYSNVLAILEALDNHSFDRMESSNSMETLYAKIFTPFNIVKQEPTTNGETKEVKTEYDITQDAPTVKILCEWAVSWQRWGEHRAMAVAWLLDKRQTEVTTADNDVYNGNSAANADDKESVSSGIGLVGGVPVFQSILMDFLDHDAPILEENSSPQNRLQFTNLVHLFSELIRHDVFSHDAYLRTLISRGDLLMESSINKQSGSGITGTGPVSNKPSPPNPGLDDDVFSTGLDFKQNMEEFDDSNVDDDLDKLLQHIKEKDQQSAMDAPDSPKDPDNVGQNSMGNSASTDPPISRHYIYTKHFPLSQDDPLSQHDCNQRYILLFGVGKERDEKKHAVKKMSKEICKLFSKKFSIDVAEGGKVKKHSRSEFNFEATTNKCQNMPYFDQHVVTWQCAVQVQEMLNAFALGNSNYLPVQEHVAFLFDLMEMALNIYGLIDMCIQILKELPEVENQLLVRKSTLVKSYTTTLSLYIIGILRRYNSCLLVYPEQVSCIFEGLCRVVKHVMDPTDCSSAERCILAYLSELYLNCSVLKSMQIVETFHVQYPKIKEALNFPTEPKLIDYAYNPEFLLELFQLPRRGGKIEPAWGRLLKESPDNRYSFVCNAIVAICGETDSDRLNDVAIACAELTACCISLSAEWIVALAALCGSNKDHFYHDLVGQIDIQNLNIHNSLAIFTCILVARHCMCLTDFVLKIALPALGNTYGGREITPDVEAGARLSCHILLKLFKTIEIPQPGLYSVSTSPNPITASGPGCGIKLSCDRHLLVAAHKNLRVEAVMTVLKGILVVRDTTALKPSVTSFGNGKRSGLNTPVHPGSTPKNMDRPVDLSHILGTSDLNILNDRDDVMLDLQQHNVSQNEHISSLSDFAQHVLKQICSQEWVLERCLQTADTLCSMLIDNMLTSKQVQNLLHMICYSENEYNIIADMDQKSIIVRILENLEQWSLRISYLDLQLMYKQTANNQTDRSNWLDMVARAAIDVFQLYEDGIKPAKLKPSIWLVAPLVSRLPSAVQGRILRVAGQVLESTNFFTKSKESSEEKEKPNANNKKKIPLNNHPFLGLVLTCLKGQDEQKEGLLASLHSQLSLFLQSLSDFENVGGIEDPRGREEMLDALQLRFSLVGGMFEAIQKNGTSTTDWAILLTQLVCQGIIDLTINCELFTTVLDMLATLIHSTLITDSQSERDENKKLYINLMKKLKKEIGDKNNTSIKFIRQLLPLSKQTTEVVSCEPGGIENKGSGFDGLRISDKQRVSVWDILEGHKNPAPLSWAWFGAVKLERKPLTYEETHRLLKYHTHSLMKPNSYFYESLPLPPEDLDPLPEKPVKDDMKADTPSSVDQSPSAVVTGRGRGKGNRKPRKKAGANTPATTPVNAPQQPQMTQQLPNNQMGQMQMNMPINTNMQQYQQNMIPNNNQLIAQQQMQNQNNVQQVMNPVGQGQNAPMGFVPNAPQINQSQQPWGAYGQMQPQQPYYNQQGMQINRFDRPPMNTSKQALSNMLRQRHPIMTGGQNNNPAFNIQQQQRQQQQQQYMRNQLRGINPSQMSGGQSNMGNLNPPLGQLNQTGLNQGINPNPMMNQQAQLQQAAMNQNPQNNQSMMGQTGMMNTNANTAMLGQPNTGMVQNTMGQSAAMLQPQTAAMGNQGAQFQGMGQNFTGYSGQTINQLTPQQNMMGYNQINPQRNTQAEFLAQQRVMQANRNQYIQPPNVTMNNMIGQGAAPPYPRQQVGSGKPGVTQQQFQQQQRIRQQQMMMQGMGQQSGAQGMGQPQTQGMGQQQTPALVAQLQRQMTPNQGMMGQQYSHQPPPY